MLIAICEISTLWKNPENVEIFKNYLTRDPSRPKRSPHAKFEQNLFFDEMGLAVLSHREAAHSNWKLSAKVKIDFPSFCFVFPFQRFCYVCPNLHFVIRCLPLPVYLLNCTLLLFCLCLSVEVTSFEIFQRKSKSSVQVKIASVEWWGFHQNTFESQVKQSEVKCKCVASLSACVCS